MGEPPILLAGLRFSLVGPGRVGRTLARWAVAAGARFCTAAGRHTPSGPGDPGDPADQQPAFAKGFGPERWAAVAELDSAGQDLLLIAVPEAAIAPVALALGRRAQAAVVLHTAGGLGAAVLAPLRAGGSAIGSLHPLKAFAQPLADLAGLGEAKDTFFALDGDAAALALAQRLAAAWGGIAAPVPAAARPLYHFAATLAAGGVVTLLAAAAELAGELGLPPAVARGYLELGRGALAAAAATEARGEGIARALTGPVARGEGAAVLHQLEALRQTAPAKLGLAVALARETLHQTLRVQPPTAAHEELAAALAALSTPPSGAPGADGS